MTPGKLYLRGRQFWRAITATPLEAEDKLYINKLLASSQQAYFYHLPLYEQRHALNVARTLAGGGFGHDRELLQAALLHDLGKYDPASGRTIPVWMKVINVVLNRAAGDQLIRRLGRADRPAGLRYIFWMQATHEERSARLACAAGSSARVVRLIEGNQAGRSGRALAWADDLN